MTAKRDLESRLADFYETEAPRRAPDWVLADALATIDTTPQRRWFAPAPWRSQQMHGSTRLAAAVIAVVLIAAAGVAVLSGGSIFTPTPTPSPTARPSVAATFEVTPSFRPAFTYQLPAEVRVDVMPDTSRFVEFRVPDSDGVGRSGWFLTVQSIEGGRVFPCSTTPGRIPLADPRAAMDYLKTVPSVSVSGETTTTVDGHSALTATLTLDAPDTDCPQLSLWQSDPESLPEPFRGPGTAFRVMLLDVGGNTIAIHTIATRETTDWFAWADQIIASMHFQP
jgi:hypothetical protein